MSRTASQPLRTTTPSLGASIELLKPITWFAPMWAYGCGVVSAGGSLTDRIPEIVLGIILAGPLVCGTSQAVNDWYDRHVDAINEPNRPIPSGRVPGNWGLKIALIWSALSAIVGLLLGWWTFVAALLGLAFAWAYSAPPLRLKANGWYGTGAVALCYEGLPWFTGAAIMAGGLPDWQIVTVALLYSLGAYGIMILNDFKAIEGDRQLGVRSIPVQLGSAPAAWLACAVMALAQVAVIALLAWRGDVIHAALVSGSLAIQIGLMRRLLSDPRAHAPWYNATGTTLFVLGMLVTAFALAA